MGRLRDTLELAFNVEGRVVGSNINCDGGLVFRAAAVLGASAAQSSGEGYEWTVELIERDEPTLGEGAVVCWIQVTEDAVKSTVERPNWRTMMHGASYLASLINGREDLVNLLLGANE